MKSKYRKIYIEWWDIKRSTIYRGVGFIVVLAVLVGGGWWLWRNNFFLPNPEIKESPKDAARLFSFEGDVRIIRAATRETILVTREVFVSAGDTIQTQGDGRAQIQMIDGSTYSIRPNSTVVISDSSSIFGGTNVRVALNETLADPISHLRISLCHRHVRRAHSHLHRDDQDTQSVALVEDVVMATEVGELSLVEVDARPNRAFLASQGMCATEAIACQNAAVEVPLELVAPACRRLWGKIDHTSLRHATKRNGA